MNAPQFQPKNEPSNNRMLMLTRQRSGLTSTDCLAEQQGEAILKSMLAPYLPQPPCNDSDAPAVISSTRL